MCSRSLFSPTPLRSPLIIFRSNGAWCGLCAHFGSVSACIFTCDRTSSLGTRLFRTPMASKRLTASLMKRTAKRSQSVVKTSVWRQFLTFLSLYVTNAKSCLDIGANPSAEEADEGVDDGKLQVIDVVHSFRLNETSFDKKSYLGHLKSMKVWRAFFAELELIFP